MCLATGKCLQLAGTKNILRLKGKNPPQELRMKFINSSILELENGIIFCKNDVAALHFHMKFLCLH